MVWGLDSPRPGGIITQMVGLICGLGMTLMTQTEFTEITRMGPLLMW